MIKSEPITRFKKSEMVNVKCTSWDDVLVEISQNCKILSSEIEEQVKPIVVFATVGNPVENHEYGTTDLYQIETDRTDIDEEFKPLAFHIKEYLRSPIYFKKNKTLFEDCAFISRRAICDLRDSIAANKSEFKGKTKVFYFILDTKENGYVLEEETISSLFMTIFSSHVGYLGTHHVFYMTLFQDNPYLTVDEPEIFRGVDDDGSKKKKRKKKKKHKKG